MTHPASTMEPMAKQLTDAERQEIVRLLGEGKSARDIAAEVGRSIDTVSRIARSIGHSFGQTNLARAHEARSAYCAERRAEIAAKASERAMELLDKWDEQYRVFSFGGRDNTFNDAILDEPPTEAKRQMSAAFRDLMRTVIEIDRHDNRADDGLAAVDEWVRHMMGEA